MIGDPSGRSSERNLLSSVDIENNVCGISSNLSQFLRFTSGSSDTLLPSPAPPSSTALLLNNYDWHKKMNAIEFLRDAGKHFRVNVMMSKDSVKKCVFQYSMRLY